MSAITERLFRIVLIAISAGLFVLCDALSAKWGKSGSRWALALVVVLAPAGFLVFGYLNRKHDLSAVSGWVNVSVAVGTVLVGIVLFGDALTARRVIGFALALMSMIVLLT